MRVITNKIGKFTSEDIENCEDILKLKEWRSIVTTGLRFIAVSMNNIEGNLEKVERNGSASQALRYKLRGHKSARQLQLILKEMIDAKIKSLKEPFPSKLLEQYLYED